MKRYVTFVALLFMCASIYRCGAPSGAETPPLETAEKAAAWMMSAAVDENGGLFWPSQPDTMSRGEVSLYHGVPGGMLFFLELYKATGNDDYRQTAERAADWLAGKAVRDGDGFFWSDYSVNGRPVADAGLYTGTAGAGAAFLELYSVLGNNTYALYARGAAAWLAAHMQRFEHGEAWNSSTDIISGAAGTGLFLIHAAELLDMPELLESARKAGVFLTARAEKDAPGHKWRMTPGSERIYPNFAHGTAGVAYYLAVLYEATGDKAFLEYAESGAEWLRAHPGDFDAAGTAWYHHEPDGTGLFYVSWCHGPGGSARLFYQLFRVTGEQQWLDTVHEAARWLMTCGLNERPIEGYWNVSACCGNAGIADFFLDLYTLSGNDVYLQWAQTMADDLLKKSSPGDPGLKWVQAENRTRPDEVFAQTGWAQGAAGIGIMFLKLHAALDEDGAFVPLRMPDSPFGR